MTIRYQLESEIGAVVLAFESCQTAKDAFSHQSHLTVAVWYLRRFPFDQATEKMRSGLHRFLDHHEVDPRKYHETLTVFWMKAIGKFMQELGPEITLLDLTNSVIEVFVDSRLVYDYFSRELLDSAEARARWVEPDLKQI